jgi:hypothetical protein
MDKNSLVKLILWLKSIYNDLAPQAKPYAANLADSARKRLVDEGIIKDPINDPVVGKNTSYEKGMKNLGLSANYDLTPEQKTLNDLQKMGMDVSSMKLIMPSLFTNTSTQTQGTTTQTQGTTVPTYNKTTSGGATPTTTKSQPAPAGTVPIRNFMKDVYGLPDDAFKWDNIKGLTVKVGDKEFNLGKPTRPEEGQIINGTWYTNPNYVDTAMSMNGIKRQKDPIREALPKYLEDKGIKGATVTWDKDSNQVILNVGDKSFKLGTPSEIGSLYNGTTYVSQSDLDKALSPFAKDLGLDTGNDNQDVTKMTIPEIKLNEEINQAGILNKSYDDLIQEINDGENDLLGNIHDKYQQLITDSLKTMDDALSKARTALEGTKGNYDEYEKTAYEEIDKNVQAAKETSKEEMAARGIYFSGLTTRAMNNIEAQGVSEKNKVHMQVLQYKAQIDSQIAILTANTEMSKSQLQNELMAREALDKLQLIEKDKDKIDAINQEKLNLDAQIKIDQTNLPLENELYRRQQEIQNQQQAMDFFEKVYMPMLRLKYEDEWKQEDLDMAYMNYQKSVLSFFNDTQEFWAQLGWDKEKFASQLAWDKDKFALELGFKQQEAASQSSNNTQMPTWFDKYKTYLTMRPDLLDQMIDQKRLLDQYGNPLKDENGKDITLGGDDLNKITALRDFYVALEPKQRDSHFLSSLNELIDQFGDRGALDVVNSVNKEDDFADTIILKYIGSTAGTLQNFAVAYYTLQQKANSGDKDAQQKLTNFIGSFEKETGVDKYDITRVFGFILNKFGLTYNSVG